MFVFGKYFFKIHVKLNDCVVFIIVLVIVYLLLFWGGFTMSEEKKETRPEHEIQKLSKEERKRLRKEKRAAERAAGDVSEKKVKAPKERCKIELKSLKAKPEAPIIPTTGTRFDFGSARQLAFQIILENAKAGKNVKDIRQILVNTKKVNGAPYNLDAAYLNFVVASHPDFFELWNDDTIVILKEPVVSADAAKQYEEEKAARKKKAEENRKKRKEEAKKEGDAEKVEKKE